MKKLLTRLVAVLTISIISLNVKAADKEIIVPLTVEQHISFVYRHINFAGHDTLDYDVFKKGYLGYINLLMAGKLSVDKPILTVCDFSLSSNQNRMWIIDLRSREILLNTFVAHGQGSGDEYAVNFSNKTNSHQSSLGFYVTGKTYIGEHGNSLYLHGMDQGFNNAAYDRNIVVHGARYVDDNFIAQNKRLGRSWGCPAVSDKISDVVINLIKDGTCLFIYYPLKKYLASSYWLNKTPESFASRL